MNKALEKKMIKQCKRIMNSIPDINLGILMGVNLILAILSGINSITLTWDDTYFIPQFRELLLEKGVFSSILYLFLNKDIALLGEMRTYGLSKAIHFAYI